MRFANLTIAALFVVASSAVQAQLATFDLSYSGASYGNNAVAAGTITINEALFNNPGRNDQNGGSILPRPGNKFVTALTLTVSGASSGNGTFTLSDFGDIILDTNGGTLDLTKELVGQPTSGDPFGTPNGNGGDFNLLNRDQNTGIVANPNAPNAFFFSLSTEGGSGDILALTSFRPAAPAAVPEPGSVALLADMGLSGAGFLIRRRKNARQVA